MNGFQYYDEYWEGKFKATGAREYVCDMFGDVYTAYLRKIFDHYPRNFERIIDLGCGTGGLVPIVREFWPQAHYTGMDICSSAIDYCRGEYPEYEWVHMTEPVIPAASCDMLVCISVFTHISIEDTERYLDQIHAALLPGGMGSLSIHTHDGDHEWHGTIGYGCMFHRPDFFEGLLKKHGFRITGYYDARQRQYEVIKC